MKKFLLIFGTLLCLQCCAFAINLADLEDGIYVDTDSFKREGNYGYAEFEYNMIDHPYNLRFKIKCDLTNQKYRVIKVYILSKYGKIVKILEEYELPEKEKGWQDIPQYSDLDVILETLKKIEPINVIK